MQPLGSRKNDVLEGPEVARELRKARGTFYGQLVLDKIDRMLESLMVKFDNMRITKGTYEDRAASIQGARKELKRLKAWLNQ